MWYVIIYILFFIAQLLYGSWHILGPMTPRHIMAILMLIVCIQKKAFKRDKYMSLFIVFTFMYIFSGIVTGYVSEAINKFLAYYLVSIVAYYATKIFLEKYNGLYIFVTTLIILGILNSVVTIGNMFMMSWATSITDFLHITSSTTLMDYVYDRDGTESMEGFAVPGLVSNVGNGYFMSYLCILALFSKDKIIHISNILIYLLFLTALFFIQERAALISGGILTYKPLYRILTKKGKTKTNKSIIFILISGCLLALLPVFYEFMTSGSSRYATAGFDYSEGRSTYNDISIEFLTSNPFGGIDAFHHKYHTYPHNLFLNALIYGGCVGGLFIFAILWKQFNLIFTTIIKKITDRNYELFLFSLMFIAYNLCSLTHNQSIVTGDPTFWVLWALCVYSWKQNRKNHIS